METVTISEYEEHVNRQLESLKQLFEGFEVSPGVSYGKRNESDVESMGWPFHERTRLTPSLIVWSRDPTIVPTPKRGRKTYPMT